MVPSYYEFYNPVKIASGFRALENLPVELDTLGARRPMIVTDQGIVKAGLLKHVVDAFSESDITIGAVFDEVRPDSSIKIVNQAAGIYRGHHCDSLVAVGGGSTIDTAKGINLVISEKTDDIMKFMGADVLRKPTGPLIAVPTTSGTGSETTLVAVIADTDRNVKMLFSSQYLLPDVAVLDPRMTLTLPPIITAATGMDALCHAVEAYICVQKNPMSDAYAWEAIRLISLNLVDVVRSGQDEARRLALANASCMAGIAFSNSMVGMVHSLGHAAGSVCHVPHGVAVNIFLPYVLEYNLTGAAAEIGELLLPLAGAEVYARTPQVERARKMISEVRRMQNTLHGLCGLPLTLQEAKVSQDKLEAIAQAAIDDASSIMNPVGFGREDALAVLRAAW